MSSNNNNNPLVQKGKDLYEENTFIYYFLNITLWLYILGFIAYLVLIINVQVTYTYNKTPGSPGTLFSLRFDSLLWWGLMLGVARMFVPFAVMNMILYRRTYGCSVFWIIFLSVIVLLDIFSFVVLAAQYGSCNHDNQPNNLCNSLLYCCVPQIFMNSNNMCPNAAPCPATVDLPNPPSTLADLSPNSDFLWLFWTQFIFILFDLVWIMLIVGLWVARTDSWSKQMREMVFRKRTLDQEGSPSLEKNVNLVKKSAATNVTHRLKNPNKQV